MTQTQQILQHLKKFGKITSWDAIMSYRITRLSARIMELRKSHRIDGGFVEINGKSIYQYIYKGEL